MMSLAVHLIFYFSLQIQPNVSVQVNPVLVQIADAFKKNDIEKIATFFNSQIELNFDDEKASYGKNQAQVLLSNFMKKNPPDSFDYLHQGSAKEGRLYAISKYKSNKRTYNVYILLRQVAGIYKIDTLDFSTEN